MCYCCPGFCINVKPISLRFPLTGIPYYRTISESKHVGTAKRGNECVEKLLGIWRKENFILNMIPYGAPYFLNWRERFLLGIKRQHVTHTDMKGNFHGALILEKENIPISFSNDDFYIDL